MRDALCLDNFPSGPLLPSRVPGPIGIGVQKICHERTALISLRSSTKPNERGIRSDVANMSQLSELAFSINVDYILDAFLVIVGAYESSFPENAVRDEGRNR